MLKRQRQSSPPPLASSNIHPTPADAPEERFAKRRRTQPQPILGGARGGTQSADDDDDDDAYEENRNHGSPSNRAPLATPAMTKASEEYKSANMMLRELHILNQHRLMFPPSASTSFSSMNPVSVPSSTYPPPPYTGDSKLHPALMQTGKLSRPYSPRQKNIGVDEFQGSLEEAGVVSEKYENMNKYVYSS